MNSDSFVSIDLKSAQSLFIGRIPTTGEKVEMIVVKNDGNQLTIKLRTVEQNLDSEPFF